MEFSYPDKGEVCIYDNILYSEYYGFEMILLIFLSVIIQADLRSSHRCAIIIRYKSIRHYWNNICKNIMAKCMEMTSILLTNIIGLCIILKYLMHILKYVTGIWRIADLDLYQVILWKNVHLYMKWLYI